MSVLNSCLISNIDLLQKSPHNNSRALLHSFSTNDAALGEYKYTVTFGQHSIKITGNNLDLVKVCSS